MGVMQTKSLSFPGASFLKQIFFFFQNVFRNCPHIAPVSQFHGNIIDLTVGS